MTALTSSWKRSCSDRDFRSLNAGRTYPIEESEAVRRDFAKKSSATGVGNGPDVEAAGSRHAAGQAAVDGDRLAVDVGGFVGGEEQGGFGNLHRLAAALERVELADAVRDTLRARGFVNELRHAGFDQAGADRIDADVGAGELVCGGLDEADDARLGRRISGAAGARSQSGDAGGADDRSAAARFQMR